jgi:GNAT superfamily N-acetyltransferase
MRIRNIAEPDWPEILRIQSEAHPPTVLETENVLRSKQAIAPATCFVCIGKDRDILAYCLAHPFAQNNIPRLGAAAVETPAIANLFVHDLAVQNSSQGQGVATKLFFHLKECAVERGFSSLSLVALQHADIFWQKMGLHKVKDIDTGSNYGEGASFMAMSIG